MQVPRSAYDGLTDAINDLSGKSRELFDARFRDGLSAFLDAGGAVPPENVAALREFAIGLLDDVGGAAAEVAYSYGAEFYDAARAAAVGSPLHASPAPPNPHAANEAAVKGMIETVAKTGQVEPFAAACAARVDYVARKSCGDAVVQCAAKDPRKPRFARVPQGGETCRFCLMLASRGAVYLTEHKAGAVDHYHANCDCKVVPDFGDGIEGYDDVEIYRKWQDLEHADAIERAERNGTTEAEEYDRRMRKLGESAKRANRRSRALEKDAKRRRRELYRERHPKKSSGEYPPSFRSMGDVALEYFGPAERSHPTELDALIDDLRNEGVEMVERENSICYQPSSTAGEPGRLLHSPGMSYSAWLHEYDHFENDKAHGYPGLIWYISEQGEWDDFEISAYSKEVELARNAGYNELVDKLQEAVEEDFRNRERPDGPPKL